MSLQDPTYWNTAPNLVLAGPSSGTADGNIGPRALVAADLPTATQNAVVGASSGYKLARGSASITGSSAINTGLTTLVTFVLSLAQAASSGAYLVAHSMLASTGWTSAQVYALTSSGSATPVVSSVAATVHWIAVGT